MDEKTYRKIYNVDVKTGLKDVLTPTRTMYDIKTFPRQYKYQTRGKSLDLIAYKLYGDVDMWVVLAEYNNIVNPYYVPDEIYIIPPEHLQRILFG